MKSSRTQDRGTQDRGTQDRDRGSGTVLVLGTLALALSLLGLLVAVAQAVNTRHRAAAAADLAALAGADAVLGRSTGAPCGRAAELAATHAATLESCSVDQDGAVEVTVGLLPPGAWGVLGPVRARSRAGPASLSPGWPGAP